MKHNDEPADRANVDCEDEAEPLRGRLSLGWQLALSTAVVVAVVMGTVTSAQHAREIRSQQRVREALLEHSMIPLAVAIGEKHNFDDVRRDVMAFHAAYLRAGRPEHQLVLRDASGAVVLSTVPDGDPVSDSKFSANIAVSAPTLLGGRGTITVSEDGSAFAAAVDRQWRSWWLHMSVTIGAILLFVLLAIQFLVTRPLQHLLDGVRKMEMGYWGDLPIPRGAWEIRWLCWRFRNMGRELQRTVQHLVAAERRASTSVDAPCTTEKAVGDAGELALWPGEASVDDTTDARVSERRLVLASIEAGGPGALALAGRVWGGEEDDRTDDWELETRLENAALRLLEPGAYRRLEKSLAALKRSLEDETRQREVELRNAIEKRGVPFTSVRHRVKHTAGVWRKMRSKGLELDQVHDLIAFRIVVPTEPDCYSALGAVHRAFEPVVGRFKDYIAEAKANGYQSLHTCVRSKEGLVFEVQIRSVAMHQQAEWGHASHRAYKGSQPVGVVPPIAAPRPWLRWLNLGLWARLRPVVFLPFLLLAPPGEGRAASSTAVAVKRLDGRMLDTWVYKGQVPGSVSRVQLGEEVLVRLRNDSPQPTRIHSRGVRVPNAMDGVAGVKRHRR